MTYKKRVDYKKLFEHYNGEAFTILELKNEFNLGHNESCSIRDFMSRAAKNKTKLSGYYIYKNGAKFTATKFNQDRMDCLVKFLTLKQPLPEGF